MFSLQSLFLEDVYKGDVSTWEGMFSWFSNASHLFDMAGNMGLLVRYSLNFFFSC